LGFGFARRTRWSVAAAAPQSAAAWRMSQLFID
jgi:hypothetical protein